MESLLIWTAVVALVASPELSEKPATESFDPPPGRISYSDGTIHVRGPFDRSYWAATENTIVREGDRLWTGSDTFAELELGMGNFVRLAPQSAVVVEEVADRVIVLLVEGSVYASRGEDAAPVSISFSRADDEPEGQLSLDAASMGRLDHASKTRPLRVTVVKGWGELGTDVGSEVLDGGSVSTSAGEGWLTTTWHSTMNDVFAEWNVERERLVRGYVAPEVVADGHYAGLYDLVPYGEWVAAGVNRLGWRPFVTRDWRPYRDGYWRWLEPYGWTWVPAAPWGYVTHHYGRWLYLDDLGWVWLPDPRWAPAWVAWAAAGPYIGWAPVDFKGRPVVVNAIYSYYDASAWVFADLAYFHRGGGCNHHGGCGAVHRPPRRRGVAPASSQPDGAQPGEPHPFLTLERQRIRALEARAILSPRTALAPAQSGSENLLARMARQAARPHSPVGDVVAAPVPRSRLEADRQRAEVSASAAAIQVVKQPTTTTTTTTAIAMPARGSTAPEPDEPTRRLTPPDRRRPARPQGRLTVVIPERPAPAVPLPPTAAAPVSRPVPVVPKTVAIPAPTPAPSRPVISGQPVVKSKSAAPVVVRPRASTPAAQPTPRPAPRATTPRTRPVDLGGRDARPPRLTAPPRPVANNPAPTQPSPPAPRSPASHSAPATKKHR